MGYVIWKKKHCITDKNKTNILIQQFVPECTADVKREFIQTFTAIRTFVNTLGEKTPHLANLRIITGIMPYSEELSC
jgi:hypothetical protein